MYHVACSGLLWVCAVSTVAAQSVPGADQSGRDLLPASLCLCDLTRGSCDANCCCDQDCTDDERSRFTSCTSPTAAPAPELDYCVSDERIAKV